jgi:hypothetical protein
MFAREGRAEFERRGEMFETLCDVSEGGLIAIGGALHGAGIPEKGLPAIRPRASRQSANQKFCEAYARAAANGSLGGAIVRQHG